MQRCRGRGVELVTVPVLTFRPRIFRYNRICLTGQVRRSGHASLESYRNQGESPRPRQPQSCAKPQQPGGCVAWKGDARVRVLCRSEERLASLHLLCGGWVRAFVLSDR